MGIIIYPYDIKTKVSTMNRNLDKLNLSIVSQKMRLKSATSSTAKALLMGQAWDTVMNYVDSVQLPLLETYSLWIREQKAANNKFGTEAGILPRVSELNEDQLNNQLRYWERRLDREYDREHPRSSVIRRCKSMIRDIRSKLLSMERFVHATEGIYDGAAQVLAILQTAQNQLKGVTYNQKEHKIHFDEISNDWLLELNSAAARSYLLTNGVTETEIKNLDDMGFAPEDVRVVYEAVKSEDDKTLIHGLMKGDYPAAFLANANYISPSVQIFLSEYMLRLSMEEGETQKLEAVINDMLKPCYDEAYNGVGGYIQSNSNAIKYLSILYAGTTNILDMESLMLYAPEILESGQYEQLVKRNEKLLALATMYGSQYDIIHQLRFDGTLFGNSVKDFSDISVDGLNYNENTNVYSFGIKLEGVERFFSSAGETGWSEISEYKKVTTAILETPNQVESQIMQETYQKLQEERAQLSSKVIGDLIANGSTAYLTAVNPLLGAGASMVYGVANGNLGSAYDSGIKAVKASELMDYQLINKICSNGNIAMPGVLIKAVQSYTKQSQQIDKKTEELLHLMEMSWFGEGGSYTVDGKKPKLVVSGIYNPEVIARRRAWEEGGLAGQPYDPKTGAAAVDGLMQQAGISIESLTQTKRTKLENSLNDLEKRLWDGDNIMDIDIQELDAGISSLTEKYQKETGNFLDIKSIINPQGVIK